MGVQAVEQTLLNLSFRPSHPQGTVERQGIITGQAEVQMCFALSTSYGFPLL